MTRLADLPAGGCSWPMADLDEAADASWQVFCADPRAPGVPYCLCHAKVAHPRLRHMTDGEALNQLTIQARRAH